jgi:hypothetical protein
LPFRKEGSIIFIISVAALHENSDNGDILASEWKKSVAGSAKAESSTLAGIGLGVMTHDDTRRMAPGTSNVPQSA